MTQKPPDPTVASDRVVPVPGADAGPGVEAVPAPSPAPSLAHASRQGVEHPMPTTNAVRSASPTHPLARGSEQRFERVTPDGVRQTVRPAVIRPRARGTPREMIAPGEQVRTLIFAPHAERAAWIERELSRAPISISIQIARRVRTVVSALVRDPPPRPHTLIIDFEAVSPAELLELHAIRHEGWPGALIGLGNVPPDLRASLEVDKVFATPLVRDSLLDYVAGTCHAADTVPIPAHLLAELTPSGRSRE